MRARIVSLMGLGLATCALLLGAPLVFSMAGPLFDVVLSVLVVLGVPLNATRMLSARLILEQCALYFALHIYTVDALKEIHIDEYSRPPIQDKRPTLHWIIKAE